MKPGRSHSGGVRHLQHREEFVWGEGSRSAVAKRMVLGGGGGSRARGAGGVLER
jgi:hypothetical protein